MKNYFKTFLPVFLISFSFWACKTNHLQKKGSSEYSNTIDQQTLLATEAPYIMPYNRILDPAGVSVAFGDGTLENHSLDAIKLNDNKTLVVEDRFGIAFFDIDTKKLIDRWAYNSDEKFKGIMSTFSGLSSIVYHDSTFIFWSAGGRNMVLNENDLGNSFVLQAYWDGKKAKFIKAFPFKPKAPATIALPNQVITKIENGDLYFYTVLNGNNDFVKVRVADSKVLFESPTGVAPFGLEIVGDKAFVSNWAGPVPNDSDGLETAGIPWGKAYVDPKTGAMSQGSVSIINTNSGRVLNEIKVGLHPNAIISSADKKLIYVSNGNSDNISVIDIETQKVVDTIAVGLFNDRKEYVGSTPNGLAINADESVLYVANGLDNAICVVDLKQKSENQNYTIKGFIPTEAYPSAIVLHNDEMIVCNLEAIGARALNSTEFDDKSKKSREKVKAFNAHKQLASISFIELPNQNQLDAYTEKVKKLNLSYRMELTKQLPRENIAPVPVPERIGEPSVFKHVLYIIKENRTYDQVLGDLPQGRGMESLCIFGDSVTPNQHQFAKDYLLMDNYHVSGKGSAEGHHWASAGMVTDYTEKSVRAWFRSYPHVLYDAMVYNKNGLIWNNALDHGKTVRIYGEACDFHFDDGKTYDWKTLFEKRKNNDLADLKYHSTTTISRIRPFLSQTFPGGSEEIVSDQMRADDFIRELNEREANGGDLPNLMVMALPNDHTSGTNPSFPTPRAMVADNDLAVGRIVEAITKSKFAKNTVIFITEDDSQAGWDHISSYRTTGFVISPYNRLQNTVSTQYNQTSMLRTMELILGLPPMNVIDATALPMFDCFNKTPDFTFNYKARNNLIPLDEMNPVRSKLSGAALKFHDQTIKYGFHQIDKGHDDVLNRILWFSVKGNKKYPAKLAGDDDDEEGE
ncbi:phosphoesterase [Lacihabitans sp. LS3-19]|uniref:bifunctional YncE family protein/alkaline phosphatase family protein n=1 Tax=Lacihabitans sp. LS3-19 TaxID=2487335 RepID=UPI0020CE0D02|nr:alkaline phosphatase family protein [Lacihabitans sp. LS3-19]MCP9770598.1 phosphoesterase [Lacihabitans sp. LS3-19]